MRKIWGTENNLTSGKASRHPKSRLTFAGKKLAGKELANAINEHFILAGPYSKTKQVWRSSTKTEEKAIVSTITLLPIAPTPLWNTLNKMKNNIALELTTLLTTQLTTESTTELTTTRSQNQSNIFPLCYV